MATEAQNRAKMKYNAKTYDRAEVKFKKGEKAKIVAHAESLGLSLNGYINKLIDDDMGNKLKTVTDKADNE